MRAALISSVACSSNSESPVRIGDSSTLSPPRVLGGIAIDGELLGHPRLERSDAPHMASDFDPELAQEDLAQPTRGDA